MGYNGYANYETWAAALWIDNDQGSHEYVNERAEECLRDADGDKADAGEALADILREDHEGGAPECSGVYSDLLMSALGSIDWRELADGYVGEAWERIGEEFADESEEVDA